MKIYKVAQRQYGKTLPELGYQFKKIAIYRAATQGTKSINNMDYVTLDFKWAKEHAIHMTITEGDTYVVLKAVVDARDVAEAYNPGEYFFISNSALANTFFIPEEKDLYGE